MRMFYRSWYVTICSLIHPYTNRASADNGTLDYVLVLDIGQSPFNVHNYCSYLQITIAPDSL